MKEKVEVTNSGLEFEGDWEEICEISRELEGIMQNYVQKKDEIEEYDEWKPEPEETEEDLEEKTADEAAIGHKKIEEDFPGAKREIEDAEKKFVESIHDFSNGNPASKDVKEALVDIEELLGAESVRALRKIEKTIYERCMLKFNPYYFDVEDFSVDLDHKDGQYMLNINLKDDDLRSHFQDIFE